MRVRSVPKLRGSEPIGALTLIVAAVGAVLVGCEIQQNLGTHADGGTIVGAGAAPPRTAGALFFVTENRYTANLGGLAGADAVCAKEAKLGGLEGEFKAWLSTSSVNAKDRIAAAGPWRRVDGRQLFPGPSVTGLPEDFPALTATGADLLFNPNVAVWTGTRTNGRWIDGLSCNDWTSASSSARGSYGECNFSQLWTETRDLSDAPELLPCSTEARLYCFGQ